MWISTDSGASFLEDTSVGATQRWGGVASSSSGEIIASPVYGGGIWISSDSGSSFNAFFVGRETKYRSARGNGRGRSGGRGVAARGAAVEAGRAERSAAPPSPPDGSDRGPCRRRGAVVTAAPS